MCDAKEIREEENDCVKSWGKKRVKPWKVKLSGFVGGHSFCALLTLRISHSHNFCLCCQLNIVSLDGLSKRRTTSSLHLAGFLFFFIKLTAHCHCLLYSKNTKSENVKNAICVSHLIAWGSSARGRCNSFRQVLSDMFTFCLKVSLSFSYL